MWAAKVGRFPADRRRRLTSTQPSRSSRPGSPLSLSRFTGGLWSISAMLGFQCACACVCEPCGAAAVRGVSGQREQPSRPAGGELPHRGSSCLLLVLLRCGAHFWLISGVCHIAELNPLLFFFSLSLSLSLFLSVICLSRYILFKVRMSEACERSSETTPPL